MDFPWLQIRVHELRQKAAKGTGPAKAVVKIQADGTEKRLKRERPPFYLQHRLLASLSWGPDSAIYKLQDKSLNCSETQFPICKLSWLNQKTSNILIERAKEMIKVNQSIHCLVLPCPLFDVRPLHCIKLPPSPLGQL